MNLEAILHIPLSNFAFGVDETHVVFRLRAALGDIKFCKLFYGDRSCRKTPVDFFSVQMDKKESDALFDYFEVKLLSPYTRICYYFELNDGEITKLYYSDEFHNKTTFERSEYYQFPFNRKEDILTVPNWVDDTVVYNIFPDSFATSKRSITGKAKIYDFGKFESKSKNGGTIKGITQNLDYLIDLGINCLYLNPIFVAGEYHKYDLIDYLHIDPCLGTDNDFKILVDECHKNNIRVIIDGVFNHCGWNFFAFNDVVENGEKSIYKDWFYKLKFPVTKPANMEDYPSYSCFGYERMMPKLNTSNKEVISYFMNVCRFWMEEYKIDGWRLDAANEVNFDFWRKLRITAKEINPQCLLIGEIWESAYPWLRGDQFDSSMNYDMRKNCRDFFATGEIDAEGFKSSITKMIMRYPEQLLFSQLNVLDTHDVPRFLTLCNDDFNRFRLAVVFLMTFIGMPSVFYGDEQGINGLKEDEYRKPMTWNSNKYFDLYRKLINIRKHTPCLCHGSYHTMYARKGSSLFIFERVLNDKKVIVALNSSNKSESLKEVIKGGDANYIIKEGIQGDLIKPWGFGIYNVEIR